jgi:hypothetical protein
MAFRAELPLMQINPVTTVGQGRHASRRGYRHVQPRPTDGTIAAAEIVAFGKSRNSRWTSGHEAGPTRPSGDATVGGDYAAISRQPPQSRAITVTKNNGNGGLRATSSITRRQHRPD